MKKRNFFITILLALAMTCSAGPGAFVCASAEDAGKADGSAAEQSSTTEQSGSATATGGNAAEQSDGVAEDSKNADAGEMLSGKKYEKGELIVTYSDDLSKKEITSKVNDELGDAGGSAEAMGTAKSVQTADISGAEKAAVFTFSGTTEKKNMKAAIEALQENRNVLSVQPNYRYRLEKAQTAADPYASLTAFPDIISMMNVEGAWDELEGTTNQTKVAVIDTGCALGHEDLQANVSSSESCIVEDGKASEGGKSHDTDGHGTHVTGIIGATYNNGKGIAGVASGNGKGSEGKGLCSVTVYDASADDESFLSFDLIVALGKAEEDGARVVNMSLGMENGEYDYLLMDKIRDCYASGICIAVAAGNSSLEIGYCENRGDYTYACPASMHEVLGVMASNIEGNGLADFSNYGMYADALAPGSNIVSTVPTTVTRSDASEKQLSKGYEVMSGTSMASPAAAGVMALILDANPSLTPDQVYNIITVTSKRADDGETYSKKNAYGMIDAEAAVAAAEAASSSTSVTSFDWKSGVFTRATILSGETYQPEYLIKPASALPTITWTSSDSSVAEVDSTGKITGKDVTEPKTAVITGTVPGGKTITTQVTVKPNEPVTGVEVQNASALAKLSVGDFVEIDASVTPSNAGNPDLYYESSDNSVLHIDDCSPYIEAVKPGTATVTVTSASDRTKTASFSVEVRQAAKSVRITSGPSRVRLGKTATYRFVVSPSGTFQTASWSVSNRYKATIDANGVLHPKRSGVVYVIAQLPSGRRASKAVTILKKNYAGADYHLKAKRRGKKSVTLKWSRIPDAVEYRIYVRSPKKKKYRLLKTKKGLSYTQKKLRKGTYRYKVRARYVEGKTSRWYSFSSVVKVKIKR